MNFDKFLSVEFLSFALALGTTIVLTIRYLNQRKEELTQKRFKIYHDLIDRFSGATNEKLDNQVAACYELRRYKEYYPVTKRILESAKLRIDKKESAVRKEELMGLAEEIDLTLSFIDKQNSEGVFNREIRGRKKSEVY